MYCESPSIIVDIHNPNCGTPEIIYGDPHMASFMDIQKSFMDIRICNCRYTQFHWWISINAIVDIQSMNELWTSINFFWDIRKSNGGYP